MMQSFWCAVWPDLPMVWQRLCGVRDVESVTIDPAGRALTVHACSMQGVQEATLRLRELGWRPAC